MVSGVLGVPDAEDDPVSDNLPIPTAYNVWMIFTLPCGHEVSFLAGT